jgi:hypothetical protein
VTLNLVSPLQRDGDLDSPQFTVPIESITDAEMHLESAFDPGGLIDVEPEGSYTGTLSDLTAGKSTEALSGELEGETPFSPESAPVPVVGGHKYRLSIEAVTAQGALALSLLSGTSNLRFDNVGLRVRSASSGDDKGRGDGKKGSGSGSSSLTDRRLFSLLSKVGTAAPAVLKATGSSSRSAARQRSATPAGSPRRACSARASRRRPSAR